MQTVILNLNILNPPRREISTYQSVSILWKGSESILLVINSFTWRHMHHYNSNLKNNCYFPAYKSYNYDAINNRCCFVTIWIRYERVFLFPFLYFLENLKWDFSSQGFKKEMVFCCAKKDNSHTNKTDIDSSSYLAVAYVSDYYVILYTRYSRIHN